MEQTGAYTTYNFGLLLFAAVLFALSTALMAGSIIGYRKGRSVSERTFAVIATAGGAAILSTLLLGVMEVLPEAAIWPLLLVELGTLSTLLWVWMLVDCTVKELSTGNDKLVWVIIILFANVLGAALYLFVRRPRRLAELGR